MNKIDLDFYNKNGFLLLKDFFGKGIVESILKDSRHIFFKQIKYKNYSSKDSLEELTEKEFNEALFRLFEDDIECLANCGKQIQHLISLHRLSLDEKVIELLKLLGLKFPNISTRPVLYFNHPKLAKRKVFHTVDAHQDWRSMQGSLNAIVIWIPLVNIDKALGALQVLPGSHLDGLRTKTIDNGFGMVELTEEEKSKLQTVEVNVGDILVFSSFLIHQSGDNITDKPRWSCHFRYNDIEEATFIERKYAHPYIYKPSQELITESFPSKDIVNKVYKI